MHFDPRFINEFHGVLKQKGPVVQQGLFSIGTVRSGGNDAHGLALLRAFLGKLHASVDFGEQRVIASDTDVLAGCMRVPR